MPTEHFSHQERAITVAKEVDRLFSLNREHFLSNVEVFKREDAARKTQRKEAGEVLDEACRAIVTERKAVKADKATPRLTDKEKQPGPGWEWRIGFPNRKVGSTAPHMVEGWMPPAVVLAEKVIDGAWNRRLRGAGPSDPSLAMMYTLLAALHDECLPNSPTILDPASGRPLEVAGGADAGLWSLYSARLWCIGAKKGDTDRLDALETYLNHVRADLEQAALAAPNRKAAQEETGDHRRRETIPRQSTESDESDLGARLRAATDAATKRMWKDTFSHPTWPGSFVTLDEGNAMWCGRSKTDSWWTRYEVLKEKAQILADDPSKTKRIRDTARQLCRLVDEFLALGTPRKKNIDCLHIRGFKEARDHWEKINGPGMKMRKAAEVLGLASHDDPIYVPTGDELGKYMREHMRAVDAAIAEVRAAETKPPLTPDAAAARAGGGAAPTSKWQDIQRQLLALLEKGEHFTSYGELAVRLKCAKNTVRKAVNRSPELQKWKAQKTKGRPKAQSLTAPVAESRASDAADPANTLPDDEVDKRMKFLIAQAPPAERPRLVAMDKDERRRLVEVASEQAEDLFNEDHAPKGNRTLDRKP